MRLDKFLKESGIIKRRSLAQKIIQAGYVRINGKTAKQSETIKINDVIEVDTPVAYTRYTVLNDERPSKAQLEERLKKSNDIS
ncbi:S4 domain-containing protein [Coprothermobacter platensis]|jgi:ribosomal 50S subunit-recycling heat shock protein|uniref:S4 domain-containing protein n=1 Tax=Coprothermobacter platensis TaxID=108819 RepID=UPI00037583E3|nr:S4 domain-containing protein [Coprothermobacter platensis]